MATFIFVGHLNGLSAQDHMVTMSQDSKMQRVEATKMTLAATDESEEYDEFDSIADDMSRDGIVVEQPQPVSNFQFWLRRIGSPIVLKFLACKASAKNWWSWMTRSQPKVN